jgi:hypothetical protein
MFGRQAMSLIELSCRVCKMDTSGKQLQDFSNALYKREPRYFTSLPGDCWRPGKQTFDLPSKGPIPTAS